MKTLILWLDALKKEDITPKETPFLYSFGQKYGIGRHKQVFGYNSVPASFMTGVYPKTHNQFTLYWYDPLQTTKNPLLNLFPPKIVSYYFNLQRFIKGEDFFAPLIRSGQAVFSLAQKKFYHHQNALAVPTLFNLLDKKGFHFLAYNWPLLATNNGSKLTPFVKGNDGSKAGKFLSLIKNQSFDLYFLHLWDLDKAGHCFGPRAEETKKVLRQQDYLAEKIINHFSLEKDLILIWSDHGMVEVKGFVDLQEYLPENGKGFLYFLDSTMARFWFKDRGVKKRVMKALSGIKKGHFLTVDELEKFKVDFSHQKYGEEIFLLKQGFVFRPNFFQGKGLVKGMHGYDLSDSNEWGMFILNRDCRKPAKTVDFLPTILAALNLKTSFSFDGQSLFY